MIAIASVLMSAYALSYLVLGERMYPDQLAESFRSRPWGIYTHAAFGLLGLGIGPFQFHRTLRERFPERHRLLGKVYLASALMVGLSGIYMALYSFGGAATHLGFGFMGAALLVTTGMAYSRIRSSNVPAHREWMIRSFSVMFSAVTFRLWLPLLVLAYGGSLTPAYQWTTWVAWVPNLLAAEWYIRRGQAPTQRDDPRQRKPMMMPSTGRFPGVLATLALAALLAPSVASAQETGTLAIRDVRVFDGERVIPRATVVVRDGSILSVGRSARVPRGARVVDGRGHTLLPGLMDAHVHTFALEMLEQALVFGVTTVLDMHTDPSFVRELRRQPPGEVRNLADIRAAGFAATAPGGHGTQYGMQVPTLTSPQEASAFVQARIAEGMDYLKIIHEPGSARGMQLPTLDSATVAALIRAAHEQGIKAVVHVSTEAAARMAIASGADGLVHIFANEPPSPDFGRFAAAHGVFVIPTLTILESASGVPSGASLIEDERLAPLLLEATRRNLRQSFGGQRPTFPNAQAAVRQLHEAGVPILAGSDAPNPGTTHGASVHRELELLVAAGLTPAEALAAATSRTAAAFGLEDRGRIAPGRRADLLLVRGDPTVEIRATRDIAAVWKGGYELDREPFRARVTRDLEVARQRRAAPAPPGSEAGLVSDFEGGQLAATFGSGWSASTDQMMGGRSTAELRVVEGGAEGTAHSLAITGEIAPGLPFAWAGAAFLPGEQPMQPANLSAWREIVFQARGDGRSYRLMLFAESLGMAPAIRTFVAGPEWREYRFPIASFQGIEGYDLTMLLFAGGPEPGGFAFQIDQVRFR